MRISLPVILLCTAVVVAGCESRAGSAVVGGVAGAAAGAGGYELHLKNQRDRVQEDFEAGRIDQREYDIRMDQIKRDSLVQ